MLFLGSGIEILHFAPDIILIEVTYRDGDMPDPIQPEGFASANRLMPIRSEERRVGKECRL